MIHYSKMWRIPAVLLVPLLLGWASAWAADTVVAETLDNGLRVLLLEDHRSPIVSFQVWYRVGSRNEARGATGIAHFLEHMMFKGTPTHGRGQFARLVEQNGGQDNAFTSHDVTSYCEVNALSWPPFCSTSRANWPRPWAGVPLNIMCSRKCAMPVAPRASLREPTRYQT